MFDYKAIRELDYPTVRQLVVFCNGKLPGGGATYYVVREICERIIREYDRQGISIDLHNELSSLAGPLVATMDEPNNIFLLNEVVRRFELIDF